MAGACKWTALLLIFCGLGMAVGGRRDSCGTDEARAENGRDCVPCPHCPAGQGLSQICGYGQGGGQECKNCKKGFYNSNPGPSKCLPCTKCELYNRVTTYKCRSVVNTECGRCIADHFESFSSMTDSHSVLYPCSHCKENAEHVQCSEYKQRHSATTSTTTTTVSSTSLTDGLPTDSSGSSPQNWKWTSGFLAFLTLVLIAGLIILVCKRKRGRRRTEKRGNAHMAEAIEMQELIDEENGRRADENANVEAKTAPGSQAFERDVEGQLNDVRPKQKFNLAPGRRPASELQQASVDINHNTTDHKILSQKDIRTLLAPVKPRSVKRSFSDPGTSPFCPGTPEAAFLGTSETTPLLTSQRNGVGVAASIAKKICEAVTPDRFGKATAIAANRDQDINLCLADTLPKIPPAVVQNTVVAAVPTSVSKVAVVQPISISALKHALNAVTNTAPLSRPLSVSNSEHLVEYTPDTSGDEGDMESTAGHSDASTALVSGRFPQQNSESPFASPPVVHRNVTDSIEDNEARSFSSHRSAAQPRNRRASTPNRNGGGNVNGADPDVDPEADRTAPSTSGPDAGHNIHITINCPSFPSIAPIYGAPVFQNSGHNIVGTVGLSSSPEGTLPCDNLGTSTELPPGAIHQPTEIPKEESKLYPNTSEPAIPEVAHKSLGTRGSSTILDIESDEETDPKTSVPSEMYDVALSDDRNTAITNCPPTCRQSVQSQGNSSTFPVQETIYQI